MITNYRKYLIVGPVGSGKSVLLASLLDWLRKRPEEIYPPSGGKWRATYTEPCKDNLNAFPLEQILGSMANSGDWPCPTFDPCSIRFNAVLGSKWKLTHKVVRDFVDFPGERFADFLGATSSPSYEEWSHEILEKFPRNADASSMKDIRDYRDMLKGNPSLSPQGIVEEYHRILRDASNRFRYLISPSSIVTRINRSDDDPHIFPDAYAPLPKDLAHKHEEAGKQFRSAFKQYQKKVVNPLRHLIRQADAVIVPVDVSWILSSGMATFHDQRTLTNAFGTYLKNMEGFCKNMLAMIGRPFYKHAPAKLKKIVICGTKLDVFSQGDASTLEELIKTFTREMKNSAGLAGVDVDFVACSAMRASQADKGDAAARFGFIKGQPETVRPSALPEEWPDEWDPRDYKFATRFDPRIKKNLLEPPMHLNLDMLFKFLEDKS